ncbi:hypothetical protein P7K49_026643 [Saguinus oedipus]|uniref:MROH2B-like HEAT-repeats domain-containing protein n=1 Tax=Saguinus oedipus TaxID=9490 RepID=A0ABQ9UG16_SAGOE|nr:hypothetical protein P7K49_026643 [Saguinus oedipus]
MWLLALVTCPASHDPPGACNSPDRLLAFLLPRLDTNNERTRVGTLQVVRHVINSAGKCLHASLASTLAMSRVEQVLADVVSLGDSTILL